MRRKNDFHFSRRKSVNNIKAITHFYTILLHTMKQERHELNKHYPIFFIQNVFQFIIGDLYLLGEWMCKNIHILIYYLCLYLLGDLRREWMCINIHILISTHTYCSHWLHSKNASTTYNLSNVAHLSCTPTNPLFPVSLETKSNLP